MKAFLFFLALGSAAHAQTPGEILKKVDEIRNPGESYIMDVKIVSTGEDDPAEFTVHLKGNDKTLVKVRAPKKNLGRNMLMLGENMWVFVPNLKRAVRVSLSQKLTGQAANGDISRMRWSGDYDAKVASQDKKKWVLDLEAAKKGLTYAKIRATVEKGTYRPLSADFLTVSGKTVKTAEYGEYKQILGKGRPTRIRITDFLKKDAVSDILIGKMEAKTLPDALFTERSLE